MDSKQQMNSTTEEASWEEKKNLSVQLMKETIQKYRKAFYEWGIPVDMQIDMFCVMLAELIPMDAKYIPLMVNYVSRTLKLAYEAGIEIDEMKKDGQ